MGKLAFDMGADKWGNDETQYYTDGDKAYTSARLTTHVRFDFRFGRVEVRHMTASQRMVMDYVRIYQRGDE